MDRTGELAEEKISTLMLKFYVPAFTGMVSVALYNIIDRIFIGQSVGHLALSGLSVTFPVMIIIMGFGMLIGIGSALLVSIELGRGDRARAERITGNAMFLIIIASVMLTAAGLLAKSAVLRSFGATDRTFEYADSFLGIILCGTVFPMTGYTLNYVIRAEGNVKKSMTSMVSSVAVNIVLDAVFILGFGMGVRGAASATVIAQAVLAVVVLRHFSGKNPLIRLRMVNMVPDPEIIRGILASGIAPFVMQIAGSAIQAVYNTQLMKYGGEAAVAVMGIINSVFTLVMISISALNVASQPVIGYNHGAGNHVRVRETYVLALKCSTVIAFVTFVIVELFPGAIISMFNTDPELMQIGIPGIRIFMVMLPVAGFQVVTSNYYQATGNARIAAVMTLLRQVILLLPVLVILPGFLGINGVWLASPVSDGLNAVFVSFFAVAAFRGLRRSIGNEG